MGFFRSIVESVKTGLSVAAAVFVSLRNVPRNVEEAKIAVTREIVVK